MSAPKLPSLSAAALLSAACAHGPAAGPARSGTLVLVHGAFADHHAFDGVAPLLAREGLEGRRARSPG